MKRIHSYTELQPGDILEALCDIPRWLGTLYHYCGKFCSEQDRIIVTDIYPEAIRVIHSEGGIGFICGWQQTRWLCFVDHGSQLPWEEQKQALTDKLRGSWPRYEGTYRKQLPKHLLQSLQKAAARSSVRKTSKKLTTTKKR